MRVENHLRDGTVVEVESDREQQICAGMHQAVRAALAGLARGLRAVSK